MCSYESGQHVHERKVDNDLIGTRDVDENNNNKQEYNEAAAD